MYHLFICDEFDAQEALRIGFVQEVHPYGKHRERAMEIARRICQCSPVGLGATNKAALTYLDQGERAAVEALKRIGAITEPPPPQQRARRQQRRVR